MPKSTTMEIAKGSSLQLTKNFNSDELDCKCTRDDCLVTKIDLDHIVNLQKLRDSIGPLKITSGYRCPEHNKAIGGASNSKHMQGLATDLQSKRLSPKEVADSSEGFNGLGRYKTFTHVDSREGLKARWGSN